jgi:hypothetical protein
MDDETTSQQCDATTKKGLPKCLGWEGRMPIPSSTRSAADRDLSGEIPVDEHLIDAPTLFAWVLSYRPVDLLQPL